MSVILVVDDDAPTREALATGLKKLGHEIHVAGTGAAALDEVRRHEVDLAIIDLKLPDMVGTELFGALRILRPEAIAIMISGHATVDEAVSAIKRGIYDFITKDFRMGELRKVVSKALETQKLMVENRAAASGPEGAQRQWPHDGPVRGVPQDYANGQPDRPDEKHGAALG